MSMTGTPPTLGCRLGLARRAVALTIAELSRATSWAVSEETIAALESGAQTDLTVRELCALARALDVWPHELSDLIEPYYL